MAPRARGGDQESNPNARQGVPPIPPGVQDHNFHTQAVFEIQREIGKLETGLSGVENRLNGVETKLDTIATNLTTLSTTVDTLKPLFVWAGRGIWAGVGSAVIFLLSVFGMWLKHHMGW